MPGLFVFIQTSIFVLHFVRHIVLQEITAPT